MTPRHSLLTLYQGTRTGGSFRRLTMLLDAAAAAGWGVHYLSPEPFPCAGEFHRLYSGRGRGPFGYAGFLLAAAAAIPWVVRRAGIDRLVVFGEHLALACVPARMVMGIPLVAFRHGSLEELVRRRGLPRALMAAHSLACRLTVPWIDAFYSVSEDLRRELVGGCRPSRPIGLLYNNIETDRFAPDPVAGACLRGELGIPAGDLVIGFSGHLNTNKNVSLLLEAFSRCGEAWLLIAGSGEQERALRERARLLPEPDRVKFLGWRADMPAVLNACDVVVLPSCYEGFPLSLLEALGCGRIALASRVGGNPEVLADPELLFPIDDRGVALAGKLARLGSDPAYREALARKCRERGEALTFDWNAAVLRALDRARVDPAHADRVYGPPPE